jgi:hypothetical protein
VGASVATAASEAQENVKAKLAQTAQPKNDQGGLRQRKPADDKGPSAQPGQLAQPARQGTEGVPVQITAILCLVSFLLAYLFF